jgi:hypothetical protein
MMGGNITVISAEPLNPLKPCGRQHIPNWGGIWVEVDDFQHAQDILMGNVALNDSMTQRCYQINPTPYANKAEMIETWDHPYAVRHYDVELKADTRHGFEGCAVHTSLHDEFGVNTFNQWVSGVQGYETSMNRHITEDWYTVSGDHVETPYSSHQEVRVGECHADALNEYTMDKHYTPGVRLL